MASVRSLTLPVPLVLAAALTGCQPSPDARPARQDAPAQGSVPAPTPPPPFASIDSVSRDEFLKYARTLTYDGRTGVSDSQALAVARPDRPTPKCPADCVYGPVASVHPEVGAIGLTDADLRVGRVIGRVVNADTLPYEKFNLGPRDTVYVWVDQANGSAARLISTDAARFEASRKKVVRMTIEGPHEPSQRYAQSTARFLWAAEDEQLWISCSTGSCCRLHP